MIKNIYIHLPFCLKKCKYCDFAVHAIGQEITSHTDDLMTRYLTNLKKEISHWQSKLNLGAFETIYFGGGTPSIYSSSQL
jgi:oxygen-independent coproporphyrinogen-3 oxidase